MKLLRVKHLRESQTLVTVVLTEKSDTDDPGVTMQIRDRLRVGRASYNFNTKVWLWIYIYIK